MEIKEGETPEDTEPTPENQEENTEEVVEEPIEEPKPEIDFKKELELLEKKPQRSELEKALYTRQQIDKRIQELGGKPLESKKDEEEYVTKKDLAKLEAKALAKSDEELNLIMWWMENKGLTAEDAYFMANKGRLKQTFEEIKRANVKPVSRGTGAGQRPALKEVPALPPETQKVLERRGFKFNSQTKEWEAKFNKMRFDKIKNAWIMEKR